MQSVLQTLKTSKALGPNDIFNRILHELSNELTHPLCCIFNKSLQSGIVSVPYKETNVCPIHEKGASFKCLNYRPISLLNSVNKVLKRTSHSSICLLFEDALHKLEGIHAS